MYWLTTVIKENGTKIECYVKQTCDTRYKAKKQGVWIPCEDFLIRGTDALSIGEQVKINISKIKEHIKMSDGLPEEIPVLITVAGNTFYNLYGGVVLIPSYKTRLDDFLEQEED